ncbi:asparagine synthase (glutamine-hydrolyzing) [Gammaproteobacteria bacterium]|nr:asparagine synthase (glutamine-hydrolyzing) [Gammaproteobacteria bacterium]
MCGVAGSWSSFDYDNEVIATNMADQIVSRGPDDVGVWTAINDGLAMAHRRLAIIDLSPAGHQPMVSSCERYVLAYNGEIYNHLDIRELLLTEADFSEWKGHSDTETLLVAISHWGLEVTLKKLNGMFAFALWDNHSKNLYLVRDRIGEKPMYYGSTERTFLFGSQLKSLSVHPSWQGEIDRYALSLYMKYGYVPTPYSIYEGIKKLPPAHFVVVSNNGNSVSEPKCYWTVDSSSECLQSHDYDSVQAVTDNLESLLLDSVRRRMEADVPLGAFLSGGIDSTMIVALMQSIAKEPVKTFSIGFEEEGYDEARHAKTVAKYLGTDHSELYVSPEDTMSVLPKISAIYDEPFADHSQIPTFIVSELAKTQVTVSLSGDGGDELFFGYSRYFQVHSWWRKLRFVPRPIRWLMSLTIISIPSVLLNGLLTLLPSKYTAKHLTDRIPKFARLINAPDWLTFYDLVITQGNYPKPLVLNASNGSNFLNRYKQKIEGLSGPEKMMYLDTMLYLPDDILAKVDRASMSVSLEARVPFLDHRLVEFAWRVPFKYKFRDGQGKWILRQVLYRYVPKSLVDRPKKGFGVPIEYWLKGPLSDWAENLLDKEELNQQGFFDSALVQKMWDEHKEGKRRWHVQLWRLLIFQMWFLENRSL